MAQLCAVNAPYRRHCAKQDLPVCRLAARLSQQHRLRLNTTTTSISLSDYSTTHRMILQHARHWIEPREFGPRLSCFASWAIPRRLADTLTWHLCGCPQSPTEVTTRWSANRRPR